MNLPPKTAGDALAVGTGFAGLAAWFNSIPWASLAACVSFVYLMLRMSFFLWDRWNGRRGE